MTLRAAFTVSCIACTGPTTPAQAVQAPAVAFVDANVVPMDRNIVMPGYTVIVRGDVIEAIGPANEVAIPAGAHRVDATGRFLMPGLADLHVHVREEADLAPYVAAGVTTLLDMGGPSRLLAWRDRIETRDLFGPHLLVGYFVDGPGGNGNVVTTTEGARFAARVAAGNGYDYIKVYNSLTTEQFDAIVEEAQAANLAVIGHGVREPGLEYILGAGQIMVAHAEEYLYTFFQNQRNRDRIPDAVDLTRTTGAYLLPNLSAFEIITIQWGRPAAVDSFLSLPDVRYLHPRYREGWQGGRYTTRSGNLTPNFLFLRDLTRAFADADLPLLLGTDSPGIPGMFPGASLYNDLRNMVEAGLTPYQALAAGTVTAGRFVAETTPGSPTFGVVAAGARADLILLQDNPLEHIGAVRTPLGVMIHGEWWTAEALWDKVEDVYREWN